MSFKNCPIWTIAILGVVLAALAAGPASAADGDAIDYPWCTQGSAIHCYYMNRDQCEEAVDYHGFCVPNPDSQASSPKRR